MELCRMVYAGRLVGGGGGGAANTSSGDVPGNPPSNVYGSGDQPAVSHLTTVDMLVQHASIAACRSPRCSTRNSIALTNEWPLATCNVTCEQKEQWRSLVNIFEYIFNQRIICININICILLEKLCCGRRKFFGKLYFKYKFLLDSIRKKLSYGLLF